MSAVTIAKMIQLQESKPISLPADFLETLRLKTILSEYPEVRV